MAGLPLIIGAGADDLSEACLCSSANPANFPFEPLGLGSQDCEGLLSAMSSCYTGAANAKVSMAVVQLYLCPACPLCPALALDRPGHIALKSTHSAVHLVQARHRPHPPAPAIDVHHLRAGHWAI